LRYGSVMCSFMKVMVDGDGCNVLIHVGDG